MDNLEDLKNSLEEHIEPLVREEGFELIKLDISKDRARTLLSIIINRLGGVTLDDCVKLNRRLSEVLEERDLFSESYLLEVSSPGVDKIIESEREYRCLIGRDLSIRIDKSSLLEGVLKSVKDGVLIIGLEDKDISIDIADIKEAKQKVKL
jgi:ribosome maturation factor RimP